LIGADFIIEGRFVFQAKKSLKGINYKNQKLVLTNFCEENNLLGFYIIYNENGFSFLNLSLETIKIKEIDDIIYKR